METMSKRCERPVTRCVTRGEAARAAAQAAVQAARASPRRAPRGDGFWGTLPRDVLGVIGAAISEVVPDASGAEETRNEDAPPSPCCGGILDQEDLNCARLVNRSWAAALASERRHVTISCARPGALSALPALATAYKSVDSVRLVITTPGAGSVAFLEALTVISSVGAHFSKLARLELRFITTRTSYIQFSQGLARAVCSSSNRDRLRSFALTGAGPMMFPRSVWYVACNCPHLRELTVKDDDWYAVPLHVDRTSDLVNDFAAKDFDDGGRCDLRACGVFERLVRIDMPVCYLDAFYDDDYGRPPPRSEARDASLATRLMAMTRLNRFATDFWSLRGASWIDALLNTDDRPRLDGGVSFSVGNVGKKYGFRRREGGGGGGRGVMLYRYCNEDVSAALYHLRGCTRMRGLTLMRADVSGANLFSILHLGQSLTELRLINVFAAENDTPSDSNTLLALGSLRQLRAFEFVHERVFTGTDHPPVILDPFLKTLFARSGSLFRALSPSLRRLRLEYANEATPSCLKAALEMPLLEELELSASPHVMARAITVDLAHISSREILRELTLKNCVVVVSVASCASGASGASSSLPAGPMLDQSAVRFSRLRTLVLERCDVKDAAFDSIFGTGSERAGALCMRSLKLCNLSSLKEGHLRQLGARAPYLMSLMIYARGNSALRPHMISEFRELHRLHVLHWVVGDVLDGSLGEACHVFRDAFPFLHEFRSTASLLSAMKKNNELCVIEEALPCCNLTAI